MSVSISIRKRPKTLTIESYNEYHRLYNAKFKVIRLARRKNVKLLHSAFRHLIINYKSLYPDPTDPVDMGPKVPKRPKRFDIIDINADLPYINADLLYINADLPYINTDLPYINVDINTDINIKT